jgi:hypothetical protein
MPSQRPNPKLYIFVNTSNQPKNEIRIELNGSHLPSRLKPALDIGDFLQWPHSLITIHLRKVMKPTRYIVSDVHRSFEYSTPDATDALSGVLGKFRNLMLCLLAFFRLKNLGE